jgi:hypothetical protein
MMLRGFQIVIDPDMTERVPYPRSPARAKRRAARGFPQHHRSAPSSKVIRAGSTLYMHPATYAALRREVANHDAR